MKLLNKLLGNAGEHYVAFQLARMGINPALLSENSKGVDILATDDGKNLISIQVKTSAGRNASRQWDVGKHCPNSSKNFFFVFLNLWDDSQKEVECFIVPSEYVAHKVNWEDDRPQLRLSKKDAALFQNNWELIKDVFVK